MVEKKTKPISRPEGAAPSKRWLVCQIITTAQIAIYKLLKTKKSTIFLNTVPATRLIRDSKLRFLEKRSYHY